MTFAIRMTEVTDPAACRCPATAITWTGNRWPPSWIAEKTAVTRRVPATSATGRRSSLDRKLMPALGAQICGRGAAKLTRRGRSYCAGARKGRGRMSFEKKAHKSGFAVSLLARPIFGIVLKLLIIMAAGLARFPAVQTFGENARRRISRYFLSGPRTRWPWQALWTPEVHPSP